MKEKWLNRESNFVIQCFNIQTIATLIKEYKCYRHTSIYDTKIIPFYLFRDDRLKTPGSSPIPNQVKNVY